MQQDINNRRKRLVYNEVKNMFFRSKHAPTHEYLIQLHRWFIGGLTLLDVKTYAFRSTNLIPNSMVAGLLHLSTICCS